MKCFTKRSSSVKSILNKFNFRSGQNFSTILPKFKLRQQDHKLFHNIQSKKNHCNFYPIPRASNFLKSPVLVKSPKFNSFFQNNIKINDKKLSIFQNNYYQSLNKHFIKNDHFNVRYFCNSFPENLKVGVDKYLRKEHLPRKQRIYPQSGTWTKHTEYTNQKPYHVSPIIPLDFFRRAPYFFISMKKLALSDSKIRLENEFKRKIKNFEGKKKQITSEKRQIHIHQNNDYNNQNTLNILNNNDFKDNLNNCNNNNNKFDDDYSLIPEIEISHPVTVVDLTQLFQCLKYVRAQVDIIKIWKESEPYFSPDSQLFNAAFELAIQLKSLDTMNFLISKWENSELSNQKLDVRMKTNLLIYGLASSPNIEVEDFSEYPAIDSLGYKHVLSWLAINKSPSDVVKFFRLLTYKHDVYLEQEHVYALLQMIGRDLRQPDLAWALLENFTRIFERTTKAFNIIIASYCKTGQTELAEGLFQKMEKSGISPDSTTYTTLIQTFSDLGDNTKVQRYYDELNDANLKWSIHTYTIIAKHHANTGNFEKLRTLYNSFPFPIDDHFQSIYVIGLCKIDKTNEAIEYVRHHKSNVSVFNSILTVAPLDRLLSVFRQLFGIARENEEHGKGFPDQHSFTIPMDRLSQGERRRHCQHCLKFLSQIKKKRYRCTRSQMLHACYAYHRLRKPNWQIKLWTRIKASGIYRDYQFMISYLTYCLLAPKDAVTIWKEYAIITSIDPVLFLWGMAITIVDQTFYLWPLFTFIMSLEIRYRLPVEFYRFTLSNLPKIDEVSRNNIYTNLQNIPHLKKYIDELMSLIPTNTESLETINSKIFVTPEFKKRIREQKEPKERKTKTEDWISKEYSELDFLPVDQESRIDPAGVKNQINF